MTPEDTLAHYEGHFVPQRFHAGFVALSYLVSLVGAGSTLELINRRTGSKGLFNHLLLAGSAATMGGVSIWSMHFVGNRAIDLADGQPQLQIAFSTGPTVLSFFVPIMVLMAAFVAIGSSDAVSWWRVSLGGLLCGAAVCGMHYLGNASIQNYTCVYRLPYLVGSAIIAVAASTIALSMFFIFRGMWANIWWKRLLSALLLAGAVSGMHWCAAMGTQYRLKWVGAQGRGASQNATVIAVICLSVGACLTIAGVAAYTARKVTQSARKAQQITLAAAVFDKHGRILVDPDGLIPSTVVTGSFVQQSDKQEFSTDHPHFLWMFQASRNWPGLLPLAEAMSKNLAGPPKSDSQDPGETQGRLFREQFCVAAMRLADHLRESLPTAGILWDQILPTGTSLSSTGSQTWVATNPSTGTAAISQQQQQPDGPISAANLKEIEDLAEKGMRPRHEQYSRGSLMFVVRRAQNDRDVERLSTVGYRFADVEQVSSTIASRMQIQTPGLEHKLRQMALYADQQTDLDAGAVHLGLFGIRARVGRSGFEVMVQRGARNLLPSVDLRLPRLEPWHLAILKRFDGMSMMAMDRAVRNWMSNTSIANESQFARKLSDGIQSLRDSLQDASLDNAVFGCEVVTVPSQSSDESRTMVVFSIVVPIHAVAHNPQYEFVSLGLFKAHQLVRLHQSQVAFVQRAHRDCGSLLQQYPRGDELQQGGKRGWMSRWRASKITSRHNNRHHHKQTSIVGIESQSTDGSGRQTSSAGLSGSSSTVDLCHTKGESVDDSSTRRSSHGVRDHPAKGPYGGIMVSEVITVNVETRPAHDDNDEDGGRAEMTRTGSGRQDVVSNPSTDMEMDHLKSQKTNEGLAMMTRIAAADEGEGQNTFVDDLFQKCVEARRWHG